MTQNSKVTQNSKMKSLKIQLLGYSCIFEGKIWSSLPAPTYPRVKAGAGSFAAGTDYPRGAELWF